MSDKPEVKSEKEQKGNMKNTHKAMLRFLNGEVIIKNLPKSDAGGIMQKIISSNNNLENVELSYDCTMDNGTLLYLQNRDHLKNYIFICQSCGFKSEKHEFLDDITHTKNDCIDILKEKIKILKGIQ